MQKSTASLPARLELSSDLSTMDSDLGVISEGLTTMFFSQILGWRAACGCGSALSFGSFGSAVWVLRLELLRRQQRSISRAADVSPISREDLLLAISP